MEVSGSKLTDPGSGKKADSRFSFYSIMESGGWLSLSHTIPFDSQPCLSEVCPYAAYVFIA